MTVGEVRLWVAYRRKYGPMNDVRRYDRPAALIGSILSATKGGKVKQSDLMPWGRDEQDKSLEDVITSLGPGVKIGKRKRR